LNTDKMIFGIKVISFITEQQMLFRLDW